MSSISFNPSSPVLVSSGSAPSDVGPDSQVTAPDSAPVDAAPKDSYSDDASGTPWYHQQLIGGGSSPVRANIDYQQAVWSPSGDGDDVIVEARPAWLNVNGDNLGPNDKVKAVWIEDAMGIGGQPKVKQMDLDYAGGGRFTAQLPDTQTGSVGGGDRTDLPSQLAINVDGKWVNDPVSGGHNFNVDLYGNTGQGGGYYPDNQ